MAENITGIESSSCGGRLVSRLPSARRVTLEGFLPRNTLVYIGSRSGSIEGFVT